MAKLLTADKKYLANTFVTKYFPLKKLSPSFDHKLNDVKINEYQYQSMFSY